MKLTMRGFSPSQFQDTNSLFQLRQMKTFQLPVSAAKSAVPEGFPHSSGERNQLTCGVIRLSGILGLKSLHGSGAALI